MRTSFPVPSSTPKRTLPAKKVEPAASCHGICKIIISNFIYRILFDAYDSVTCILDDFSKLFVIKFAIIRNDCFVLRKIYFCSCSIDLIDCLCDSLYAMFAVHTGNFENLLSKYRILKFFIRNIENDLSTAASTAWAFSFKMFDRTFQCKPKQNNYDQHYNYIYHYLSPLLNSSSFFCSLFFLIH